MQQAPAMACTAPALAPPRLGPRNRHPRHRARRRALPLRHRQPETVALRAVRASGGLSWTRARHGREEDARATRKRTGPQARGSPRTAACRERGRTGLLRDRIRWGVGKTCPSSSGRRARKRRQRTSSRLSSGAPRARRSACAGHWRNCLACTARSRRPPR